MEQLEQPGAHDRAVAPDAGDLVQVEVELRALEHLEPLGVGLHQAVLDPVVDHLHEVAGARPADVRVAVLRARACVKIGSSRATGSASPPTIRQ